MQDTTWTIRHAELDELPLVRNSWFHSHRQANADVRAMGGREYARWANTLHDDVLRAMPDILVADSDGLVLGWAIGLPMADEYIVPYVYVKSHSRRLGIAKALVEALRARAGDLPVRAGLWSDIHADRIRRYVPDFKHVDEVL